MGFWNKLFGGADGIRESMRETYAYRYQKAQECPPASGDTPHQFALYQALGSRYIVTRKPWNEMRLHLELVPFYAMERNEAVDMLTEYIVYQERPTDARTDILRERLNAVVRALLRGETPGEIQFLVHAADIDIGKMAGLSSFVAMAYLNRVPWCDLLDKASLELLARTAREMVAKLGEARE